jgi:hypothetical protein
VSYIQCYNAPKPVWMMPHAIFDALSKSNAKASNTSVALKRWSVRLAAT